MSGRWPRGCNTPTSSAWSIATSSRPTCSCSIRPLPRDARRALSNGRPDPVVKIIDWGLAQCLKPAPRAGRTTGARYGLRTEKGRLIGTADYVAPEQARDATLVDIRADIYSLGCTLYYLLAGQPPFPGTSLMQKLLQHQEAEPAASPAPTRHPGGTGPVNQRMLAKQARTGRQIPLLVVTPLRGFSYGPQVAWPVGRFVSRDDLPAGQFDRASRRASRTGGRLRSTCPRPPTQASLAHPSRRNDLPRPAQESITSTAAELRCLCLRDRLKRMASLVVERLVEQEDVLRAEADSLQLATQDPVGVAIEPAAQEGVEVRTGKGRSPSDRARAGGT